MTRVRRRQVKLHIFSIYWVRFFIRWHVREGAMRHSRGMGTAKVKAFFAMLAAECHKVSPQTNVSTG
jgi:hypothetical protein